MSDHQLIARISKGDTDARMVFYKLHVDMLFVTVNRILNNRQLAEDVVHDAILKAFECIGDLKNPNAASGWVRTIARRMAIDQLKRELIFDSEEPIDSADEIQIDIYKEADISNIRQIMDDLPAGYKAILNMHLIEELSFEEIAGLLEVKPSTVRSQFARGRMKLVTLLNRYHVRQS